MRAGGEGLGATARRISQRRTGRAAARLAIATLLLALLDPAAARAEVKRLGFPVSGMHSPLATRGVEEAIRQLPGVARVTADLGTGRVEVEAENQKTLNLQEVRTRAARAGYPVSGDLDILARGRFDTGVDGRITFKVTGTTYAWQVLESGTLLEMIKSHPGLRGEFVAGFRLFEKPAWNSPAISLTQWEAVPAPTPAVPAPARPLRPQPAAPSASTAPPPASKGGVPPDKKTGLPSEKKGGASKAVPAKTVASAKKSGAAKNDAVVASAPAKKADAPPDDPKKKKKRSKDPQDPEKP